MNRFPRWVLGRVSLLALSATAFFAGPSWVLTNSTEGICFAASNWGSRPSWASNSHSDESATPRRNAYRETFSVSPFSPGSNNLAIDVGQVFLMGDLSSNYSDAIGSQLHYTYGVSEMFGFDSSIGYSSHSEGRYSMTTLLTGLRMNLAWYDKIVPYLSFGLGFYRPSYEITSTTTLSPIVFGLHAGPGVSLELTRQLFFGASLSFHDVFGTTKYLPDGKRFDVSGTYTSFLLNAGLTF